jgi:hypothetical protein
VATLEGRRRTIINYGTPLGEMFQGGDEGIAAQRFRRGTSLAHFPTAASHRKFLHNFNVLLTPLKR